MAGAVFLIYGGDDFMVSARAKSVVAERVPADQEAFGLEIVDGRGENADEAVAALGRCLAAVRTVAFFGSGKVVWFRDVNFLGADSRTGKAELVKKRLDELTACLKAGIPDGVTLLISATAADARTSFVKACQAAGKVLEFALPDKEDAALKQSDERARDVAGKLGLRFEGEALEAFTATVGTATHSIVSELEKLDTYLGKRRTATLADVRAITSSSRGAGEWALSDAFGRRDLGEALKVLRQMLFQKASGIGLLMQLQRRVRDLLLIREGLDAGWVSNGKWTNLPPAAEDAMAAMEKDPRQMHWFRLKQTAEQAQRFTRRELQLAFKATVDAHEKLVTSSLPERLILEQFLMQTLCARPAPRPAAAPAPRGP